jgi:hypothetical protein
VLQKATAKKKGGNDIYLLFFECVGTDWLEQKREESLE